MYEPQGGVVEEEGPQPYKIPDQEPQSGVVEDEGPQPYKIPDQEPLAGTVNEDEPQPYKIPDDASEAGVVEENNYDSYGPQPSKVPESGNNLNNDIEYSSDALTTTSITENEEIMNQNTGDTSSSVDDMYNYDDDATTRNILPDNQKSRRYIDTEHMTTSDITVIHEAVTVARRKSNPVNSETECSWSKWAEYSQEHKTCGQGVRTRFKLELNSILSKSKII